ncbi:MAG TPA: amidohydrolase family protein [Propylenella sp.]|nr:amidohydrolase family protein [Propylenella sp.]
MISKKTRLRPGPIDIHAHVMPPALLDSLTRSRRPGFAVEAGADGGRRVTLGGREMRNPVPPAMDSLEIRFRTMEEQGISAQLISPWIALVPNHLQEADAFWLAEALNEGIAGIVQDHPDRFLGIGSAPLQWPERAAAMLRAMMGELGLRGIEINTTLGPERFLDDPALDPFWAEAEALGALIMIHPSLGGMQKRFERYYLNNLVHNPLETTVAAAHLIFGGVMERFPKLNICLVHGGGLLPYNVGRLRRGRTVRPETAVSMTGSVEDSYRRFLFDSVTHSVPALRFLSQEVGAHHVFLGSDYPFDMGDPDPVATVRNGHFEPSEEQLILRGNIEKLLRADAG